MNTKLDYIILYQFFYKRSHIHHLLFRTEIISKGWHQFVTLGCIREIKSNTSCIKTRSLHNVTKQGHYTRSWHKVIAKGHYTRSLHKVTTQGHYTRPLHKVTPQGHYSLRKVTTQDHSTRSQGALGPYVIVNPNNTFIIWSMNLFLILTTYIFHKWNVLYVFVNVFMSRWMFQDN